MTLGLDQPSVTSVEVAPHKSAGLAFLLSLVVPGAGQIYCGKTARGAATLGFFAAFMVLTVVGFSVPDSTGQEILGLAMLAIPVLYVFSFLDAYYVAREINNGTDPLVDTGNPRVATTLNLLTNGFGYWYLGERNKGWIAFVVLGLAMKIVSRAIGDSPWSLLLLLIPCAMALDAYRIARKQLEQSATTPPTAASIESSMQETRLPAAVPIAFALILVVTLVGAMGFGLAVSKFERIDQSRAIIDHDSNPKRYENPTYGVRFLAPSGWEIQSSDKGYLATARKEEQGCQVMLMEEFENPFHSLTSIREQLSQGLLTRNANFRKVADRSASLGNLSGVEAEFVANVSGNEVIQRYLIARRALTVYALITTIDSSQQQGCEPEAKWIQDNVRIQK